MIATGINIAEELLKYFRSVKLADISLNKQDLLEHFWDPVLQQEPVGTRMQAYHCLSNYEKAWSEFMEDNLFLAQNTLDYADYHAWEMNGPAKPLLEFHHDMVQALALYTSRQYDEAYIQLLEAQSSLNAWGAAAILPRMLCHLLLAEILFSLNRQEEAAAIAALLMNPSYFPESLSVEHRIACLHHITDNLLNNIHDRYRHDPGMQSQLLDTIFTGTATAEEGIYPISGFTAAAGLLLQYHQAASMSFIEGMTAVLPLFDHMPVFLQYFLLQKTFSHLQTNRHPDLTGISDTLRRYYAYIRVTQSLNTKTPS